MSERYSRHTMLPEIGEAGQERLHRSSVLLVGVGGLGSPIALYLAAAGVGRIGLVDCDTVSESNLQRQVLYRESEVGELKVECARRRLLDLNSQIVVDTHAVRFAEDNARELVSEYDIVVDGCDNFTTRYLIDECCAELGRPYVYGSIGAFRGQVSLFNYEGGCRYRDLYPDRQLLESQPLAISGVMGVVPGVVGCVQAAEVVKVITGCGTTLRNRLYTVDLLTMESLILDLA
ncbi:MAG: HesA/MoeB/ThiF family protein [Rikenellaceae bacterium]